MFFPLWVFKGNGQNQEFSLITNARTKQLNNSRPWVFWYWMHAAVSKVGITADLKAMKQNGIGGAYLMPIKGITNPPLLIPASEQLSPLFWEMVKFAMQEADRLGLKMGMHFSDGFALGGGPWITPELSMQKLVFSEVNLKENEFFNGQIPMPQTYNGYYKNIAVLAFPTPVSSNQTQLAAHPVITSSNGIDVQYLSQTYNTQSFRSDDSCWLQFEYKEKIICRTIKIKTIGNNFQAQRLLVLYGNDGVQFDTLQRLVPPRHGWQDADADFTYSVKPTTAKYFRFVFDKTGSEPGAEDLDAAKWKPTLKLAGIEITDKPFIHQYEGKSAQVWRLSDRTTEVQVPDSLCIPLAKIIDITNNVDALGFINWKAPKGNWTILKIGSTSTGHTNATGGGAIGLECDKFNTLAVNLQFEKWFGQAIKEVGTELSNKVLKVFHVDSWECGSQNWSPVFREEFLKRRGYDLLKFLPAMAGLPVQSANVSENFLHDIRLTIMELVNDNFYGTLKILSHEKNCTFTAESIAPTMLSDGLLHYNHVDIPMGEFWYNSPTHDKPNDMIDAISGAHIYGKKIIQAEAFTTVRMDWSEHPGKLKTLQDRNYALGINKLVFHVFTHNPWLNKKPGMTLDGVGLYFQRDQTWWKAGKAWMDYTQRCQSILQRGNPVVDIAVYTGEEIPSRSILPDRLVASIPGIFGNERVISETARKENTAVMMTEKPDGVRFTANTYNPENWIDPLHGYQYDCINTDALIRLASVENGRIILPGGASYGVLIIPGSHSMSPNGNRMSLPVAYKISELVKAGAKIILTEKPIFTYDNSLNIDKQYSLKLIIDQLWKNDLQLSGFSNLGNGIISQGIFRDSSFEKFGIKRDLVIKDQYGKPAKNVAWTHRRDGKAEVYFISNQDTSRHLNFSFRAKGNIVNIYNAVTNKMVTASKGHFDVIKVNERTEMRIALQTNASLFITIKNGRLKLNKKKMEISKSIERVKLIKNQWKVQFDKKYGGPSKPFFFDTLNDWSRNPDSLIAYYSGTAIYGNSFSYNDRVKKEVWLSLGRVANIASVKINGIDCGVAWTYPYQVEITNALKQGKNIISLQVTNTWANRLIGDNRLPLEKRITNTTAPYRLQGKSLLEAGLIGPVSIRVIENVIKTKNTIKGLKQSH